MAYGFDTESEGNYSNALRAVTAYDQMNDSPDLNVLEHLNIAVHASLYGIANNFTNLGKFAGVIDDSEELIDIERKLANVGSGYDEAYAANAGLYDLAGDVITSFVPGGIAVKALGVANKLGKAGKIGSMMKRWSSQSDNLELAIKKEVASLGRVAEIKNQKRQLALYKTMDQAFEGAVTGLAVEITLNAGDILNDEGLTATQKLGALGFNIGVGAIGQGIFGGIFSSVAARGRISKYQDEVFRTQEAPFIYKSPTKGNKNITLGSAASIAEAMSKLHEVPAESALSKKVKTANLAAAATDFRAVVSKTVDLKGMSSGDKKGFVDDLLIELDTPEGLLRVAGKLEGAVGIKPISSVDIAKQRFTANTFGHRASDVNTNPDLQTVDGFIVGALDKFKTAGNDAKVLTAMRPEFSKIARLAERDVPNYADNVGLSAAVQDAIKVREELGVVAFKREFPYVDKQLREFTEPELTHLKSDTNTLYYDSLTGDVVDTIPLHLGDQPGFSFDSKAGVLKFTRTVEGENVQQTYTLKDFEHKTADGTWDLLELQSFRLLMAKKTADDFSSIDTGFVPKFIGDSDAVLKAQDAAKSINDVDTYIAESMLGTIKAKLTNETYYGHAANDLEVSAGSKIKDVENFGKPRTFAIKYKKPKVEALSNSGVMSAIESEKALLKVSQRSAVRESLGEVVDQFPESFGLNRVEGYDLRRMVTAATQIGDYGSIEAKASYLNEVLSTRLRRVMDLEVLPDLKNAAAPVLQSTEGKAHLAGYLEWHSRQASGTVIKGDVVLNAKTAKDFKDAEVLNPGLVLDDYLSDLSQGSDFWRLTNPEALHYVERVNKLIKTHITEPEDLLRSAIGEGARYVEDGVYLPARDYKHMMFIRTNTKNPLAEGASKTYRVTADSASELRIKVNSAMNELEKYEPLEISRKDAGQFAAAKLEYDFNGTNIQGAKARSGLKKSGQYAAYTPESSAEVLIAEHSRWFQNRIRALQAKSVSTYYADDFAKLARLADEDHARFAGSTEAASGVEVINGTGAAVRRRVSDYAQVQALAQGLDVGSHNFWKVFNNSVENFGAGVAGVVNTAIFNARGKAHGDKIAKTIQDESEALSLELAKQGVKLNAGDYVKARLSNKLNIAPEQIRGWVGSVNALQATLMFRLDSADAVVNVLGAAVKVGGELRYLKDIYSRSSPELQAAFDTEMQYLFGAGSANGVSMLSSAKAVGVGFKEFFSPEGKALAETYEKLGFISPNKRQLRDAFEEVRIDESDFTTKNLDSRLATFKAKSGKVIDIISTPSDMSNLAVQFSVVRMADRLGRSLKLDDAAREHLMHMMNRRVNAITNPTQKPRLFQGAAGIAMSLYQSYTFHMMNNLFRYAHKGSKAAPIMIASLNSAFFGAQSVPGFQQLNSIIGSQTDGHVDLYGATSKVLNADPEARDLQDFLVYGAGSALLQANLFVRGDLNPRSPTLVPTNVLDVPLVSTAMKLVGAIGEGVSRAAYGENIVFSTTDALVNVGLNRPLKGIWAAGVGKTVDSGGKPVAFHEDIWSYGTAVRALGFKPLNEAIMQQYQSRTYQYKAQDLEAKKTLGKVIMNEYEVGRDFEPEALRNWQRTYTKHGGNASGFIDFMERTMIKSEKDLSLRLEKAVGNNPEAMSQYQTILGF